MFTRIAPQRAQHDSGFIVQVGGRESVQYLNHDLTAEIQADMLCQIVPIYIKTMIIHHADGISMRPTPEERDMVLNRVKSGLEFLGIEHEIDERHI